MQRGVHEEKQLLPIYFIIIYFCHSSFSSFLPERAITYKGIHTNRRIEAIRFLKN